LTNIKRPVRIWIPGNDDEGFAALVVQGEEELLPVVGDGVVVVAVGVAVGRWCSMAVAVAGVDEVATAEEEGEEGEQVVAAAALALFMRVVP